MITAHAPVTAAPAVDQAVHHADDAFDMANDNAPGSYLTAASDGMEIYYNVWKTPEGITPIAVVLAVHGIGEHIHRYNHVFSKYAEAGIVVKGLDYRGHGRTLKKNLPISQPGFLGSFELVWADILAMNDIVVPGVPSGLPTFVMGHSLGGLLALSFVKHNATKITNFRGVISQAPAIRPATPISGPVKFAAKLLGASVLPRFSQPNGLIVEEICTEKSVVDGFISDPLNHGFITLSAARDIVIYGEELTSEATKFAYPIIMYFSRDDKLTGFEAGKGFIEKCGSTDKTFKEFSVVRHEPYVQLATVKANGRPANRTVVFRGFWNPADRALFEEASIIASGTATPHSVTANSTPSTSPKRVDLAGGGSLGTVRSASLNELDSKAVDAGSMLYNRANNSSVPVLSGSSVSVEERGNHVSTPNLNPSGWLVAAKLGSLLEFVTDVRSAKCDGWSKTTSSSSRVLAHDVNRRVAHIGNALSSVAVEVNDGYGRFAEVCWYFPETREQFRLSGRLHLIASPKSGISTYPPWAPRDTPFERERRRLWRRISPSLRASFTGSAGAPGSPFPNTQTDPRRLDRLQSLLAEEDEDDVEMVESPVAENLPARIFSSSDTNTTTDQGKSIKYRTASQVRRAVATEDLISIHDEAFSRFGLLLLDVEEVDHVDLRGSDTNRDGTRTQYRVVVPERTYGRITGLKWEEKRVVP
ncbi:hypothetical protein HDU67_005517 [Dinochytrium kinnereticum]|nr:hypothetical protein HDU67_005517 [Dinochytrium kinnereticum]